MEFTKRSTSLNVALVSNTIPLFDELCRRVLNFIYTCLHCDSNFVRSIVSHGVTSGTSSPIGRNAVFCSSHFNIHFANIGHTKLTGRHCLELYNSKLAIADLDRAVALREVLFIREGLLTFSNSDFCTDDVETFIRLLSCRKLIRPSSIAHALFYLIFNLVVLLCTILMLNKNK